MAVRMILAALFFLLFPAKAHAAFTLESVTPTEITSEAEELTLFVSATNLSQSTQFLQAAITKEGISNYFGFTKGSSGNWIKYSSSPEFDQIVSFSPTSGSWNGEVKAKLDTSDSGFQGPGTYLVKLLKYITGGGTSSNQVPITVSLSSNTSTQNQTGTTTPTIVVTEEKKTPIVQISLPSNLKVGEEFEASFNLVNFNPGTYSVKARIGKDTSHLTQGQTWSSEWLTDTDSWSKFPQFATSSKIKARLSPASTAGDYKIKLSFKKGEDPPILSEEKSVSFKENPNPQVDTKSKSPVIKTPAPQKSSVITLAQNSHIPGDVLASSTESATIEAVLNEHYKDKDFLATITAVPKTKKVNAKNLLLRSSETNPTIAFVIIIGGLLTVGGVAWFIKGKFF